MGSQRVGHRLRDFHTSLITILICIPEIYIHIYIQWIHESILFSLSQLLPSKASSLIWWRIIIVPAYMLYVYMGLPGGSVVKNLPAIGRPGFNPWVGKIPWRRERLPTPVFWPGEFHGLYSQWGHKESDTTEQISFSLWLFNSMTPERGEEATEEKFEASKCSSWGWGEKPSLQHKVQGKAKTLM